MSDEKPEEPVTPAVSTPVSRRKGGGLLFLVLLLLVAAVAGGGWFGWQLLQRLGLENREQQQAIEQLREEQQRFDRRHEEASAGLRQRLDQLETELMAQRDRLRQLRTGGQTDWLLNEAEALASLAQQRLLLTGDVAAARRLLEASDKVLRRVDLPEAVTARKALASDLEKLRGAEQVDIAGLVMRLDALRESAAELAVPAAKRADSEAQAPLSQQTEPADNGWMADFLAMLPVRVRPHDQTLPLPLDRQQASLLRIHLNVELQKAQLAALQARPKVYDEALKNARQTLATWFSGDAAEQLDTALKELQQVSLNRALPEIGQGLSAIRGLIGKRGSSE